MRLAPRALLAGGLGLAASLLVACGGGAGLLSGDQANNLQAAIDSVSTAVQSGNCAAAENAAQSLQNEAANLPPTVNRSLKTNLNDGVSKLTDQAAAECHQHAVTTTSTSTTTTSTTDTTSSTPTTTTTSSSSSTSSTPSTTSSSTTSSSTATTTSGSGTSGNGSGGVGPGDGGGTENGGPAAQSGDGNTQ